MKVFVSHTGINNWDSSAETQGSTLKDVLTELNNSGNFNQIYNTVCPGDKIASSSRVFANVDVINQNGYCSFYEKMNEETIEIRDISKDISSYDNLLISVFNAESLIRILNDTVNDHVQPYSLTNEDGITRQYTIKPLTSEFDFNVDAKMQTLYDFVGGDVTLEELKYGNNEEPVISYDANGMIDKKHSKVLPEELISAIRDIWNMPAQSGVLRLFQEDSLFFIMERLMEKKESIEKQLLLSMPTGGGKTEAFMIPIIASIYEKKKKEHIDRIRSIVIYPTNALANDQAMRFVELVYKVNHKLVEGGASSKDLITIGILTGDTPKKTDDLVREAKLVIDEKDNCDSEELEYVLYLEKYNTYKNIRIKPNTWGVRSKDTQNVGWSTTNSILIVPSKFEKAVVAVFSTASCWLILNNKKIQIKSGKNILLLKSTNENIKSETSISISDE